ncbi:uncharacterized protein Z518_00365 [Rhinocladiella mackenziei CBS 650.93]|uniref:NmrA-like domain-containing protein n=1 Tax=Rhinocladiella mackenziei CBS 650.93 TaxID=1442369 RepID=A0A0D2J0R8_9EURO|nr:uncharacterized protein Z518_00365 [Rhinocladiella mackenziei CBS 650.93]KIX09286.1 hypothetical protein Z518_00365 [Rhinocladiella mackenziei CBS 650.93]
MAGSIKKVVVLGATGNVGKPVVTALAAAGYTVTAASRTAGQKFPDPIIPATVDYSSVDALVELFQGQDAVVEAFPPNAATLQPTIVDACLKSGTIKHIITPDFAGDTFSPHITELPLYVPKVEAQKQLEEKIKGTDLTWSAIITGGWYDWAIPLGYYWINPQTNTIMVYGSGNQRNSMCRVGTAAKAVCDVLADPRKFQNRPVYVADHTVSMNQLIPMLEEVRPGWNIVKVDLDELFAEAKRLWDEDTEKGVEVRLLTKAYNAYGTFGIFEENNRYNADFEAKIEPGYGYQKSVEELKEELKTLVGGT